MLNKSQSIKYIFFQYLFQFEAFLYSKMGIKNSQVVIKVYFFRDLYVKSLINSRFHRNLSIFED